MHLSLGVLDVLVFLVIAVCIQRIIQYRRRNPAGLPLPSGPNGLPFLGNIFNFPRTESWMKAVQWQKEFGEWQSMVNLKEV